MKLGLIPVNIGIDDPAQMIGLAQLAESVGFESVWTFEHVIVPELNNGQLVRILRDQYRRKFLPLNKIQGRPFRAEEILEKVRSVLGTPAAV